MSSYDPTDTQGDKRAKYRFFSTVRRGYRPSTEFTGAKSPQSGDGAPSLETSGDVTVDVHGRADDEDLLTEILEDYDGYQFAGEYDCLGGVVVESRESRVRVNNTFDSILDGVWEDNLKELSELLFDR